MEVLIGLLVLVVFTVLGFIFGRMTERTHGTLVVDLTDPMKDIYRLEIDDIGGLSEQKRVILKVDKRENRKNNNDCYGMN